MTKQTAHADETETSIDLKCADSAQETAEKALEQDKEGATTRIGDEKGITEGDILTLTTTEGKEFGTAEVTRIVETTAWEAYRVISKSDAIYGVPSSTSLVPLLNTYYDREVKPSTNVKIIFYRRIE